jgi:bifunctional DNA-binding transcriptional regulator/antitoxin component of YhaV-PrlF toxin-antitoxin module
VRITTKGQVTIPQLLREKYGLLPHTEVTFVGDEKGVRIELADEQPRRGRALIEAMRGTATTSMSTDELMALTRGD